MAWNWNGARWWKFDLHKHTPASNDYGKGTDQAKLKSRTPTEWLLDYMRVGIDCVAVTDHNSGTWIDRLKITLAQLESTQPEGFRPVYLFPGVEISANGGVHLLAVLDPSKSTSDIDSLLGAAGFKGTKGASDGVTIKSFTEVVGEIERAGGIAIPAHVHTENGLFKLQGTTLAQALDCGPVVAMEVADPSAAKPPLYRDKALRWTEVLGSDAHHPTGSSGQRFPGSHFTWVKMGPPSLEGLRLALLDGSLSVRRSEETTADPNRHAPLVMEAVEVCDARYMGRSGPFRLVLNPWLNAIIGGRGTGKSTLVEFLRLALRRDAELPLALAADFEKYRKIYLSREDDGLLTENARLTVTYRKDRTQFRIRWSQRGDIEPIEVENGNGGWKPDQGDVAQRFPVRIYSQKQIFELAKAPLALLRIVDEAPAVDRRSWDDRWREESTRFLSLRAMAREIEGGLGEEPRLRGELEDVKRRLAIFEEAGHAGVLKEYQKRLRQQRGVLAWEQTWAQVGDRLRNLATDLLPDPLDESLFDAASVEDQGLLERATVSLTKLEAVRARLEGIGNDLDDVSTHWRKARDESAWTRAVDAALKSYETLCERLKAEQVGDPSGYGELVQRRQVLEERLKQLESRRKQLESVRRDGEASLGRLQALRPELTRGRREFLSTVLAENPYVRIDVLPYGARDTVELEFRRLLQREMGGFEKDIGTVEGKGLLGSLYGDSGGPKSIEIRLAETKKKIRAIASGTYVPEDQRFAAHLAKLPPEAFDRLHMWFPEDSLRVEYSTT
ncbi:MAG: TrlF family AAA-like ATPase, partial [Vicinamibacteria bacterium]